MASDQTIEMNRLVTAGKRPWLPRFPHIAVVWWRYIQLRDGNRRRRGSFSTVRYARFLTTSALG